MPKVIEAIYENGVLKPLEEVELKDGEKVRIRIESLESVLDEVFGILKGDDTIRTLREIEDEWGVH